MLLKAEIDLVIGILVSVMRIIHHIDPDSDNNPVIVKINQVIAILQNLGL